MSAARPRIAIAGISHESSTFSLHRTGTSEFDVRRGDDILPALRFAETLPGLVDEIDWVPIVRATAIPGGPVDPAFFDALVDSTVRGLTAALEGGPLDGVYLFLHGAVNVEGREDAEAVFARAVRDVVGPSVPVSASMDTHGNCSPAFASLVDLASAHRHAPHIDIPESHARAVRNLVEVIRRGELPYRALVTVPVLLAGEHTSTLVEPAKTVFGGLLPAIERYGVIDAALFVGFMWADEERNAAAAFVTGWDAAAVSACAAQLGRAYWDAREGFVIVAEESGTWDEALAYARTRPTAPLYVSDSGDNVSAGASGDITVALHDTIDRADVADQRFLFAGIIDPASLDAAIAVGAGGTLSRGIGAWTDSRWAGPVERDWEVVSIIDGLSGEGVVGALLRSGNVDVTVQNHRAYFITPDDEAFKSTRVVGLAWVEPDAYDVVVVKNGYLFPGQIAKAGSWFMAITPGGTDLDPARLSYQHIRRPMFPVDRDFEADLTPVVFSAGTAEPAGDARA